MVRSQVGMLLLEDAVVLALRTGRMIGTPTRIERHATTSRSEFILETIDSLVRPRGRQPALVLVQPAPAGRCGVLFGVEADADAASVAAELERCPESFFTGAAESLLSSSAVRRETGWCAAVVDKGDVMAVDDACRERRIPFLGAIPADAFGLALSADDLARAGTTCAAEAPFLVLPGRTERLTARHRSSVARLVLGLVVATLAAAGAPVIIIGARAAVEANAAEAARAAFVDATANAPLALQRQQLAAAVSQVLGVGEATSVLLSRIAVALPEQAIISAFDIDSTQVRLTLLAPPTVDVITPLGLVSGLAPPTIDGGLTRETLDGYAVQRTRLVLTRRPSARALRVARRADP